LRVLVTGTEGYLGCLLAPVLLEDGHDVVGLDTGYYQAGWLCPGHLANSRHLKAGTVLDRLGGYHYYGEAEKAHIAREERLLPIGAAEGYELIRDVPKDATLTCDVVRLPPGRLVDQLLEAQGRLPAGVPPGLTANA
jgi:nucleoside-diphosphate-sugar epimerase